MKLYRGLKNDVFELLTPEVKHSIDAMWFKILTRRSAGDFFYPNDLNDDVIELSKLARFSQQHFTDQRGIAVAYAKQENGVVVEIDVPEIEVIRHFRIEFQNFGKRKTNFEVVYVVSGELLYKNSNEWKIKVTKATELQV